jgi:hypothetical protein
MEKLKLHRATAHAATVGDRILFVAAGWARVHWPIYRTILLVLTGLI